MGPPKHHHQSLPLTTFLPALLSATVALCLAVGLVPIVRSVALQQGIVDHPGPRKIHASPMPLLGGIAIFLAASVSVAAVLVVSGTSASGEMLVAAAAATLLLVVGTLDDRGKLHHQVKLMVAMPIAAVALVSAGFQITLFRSAGLPADLALLADVMLSVVWIVGITAAFSILDHMDGLCAGVACIGSLFLGTVLWMNGDPVNAFVVSAVAGSAAGFLFWNFHPAKIFMGDGGAMFLGVMMASAALMANRALPPDGAVVIPLLVLIVPILDTALVIVSRGRRGLVPFATPGKDHTAHRLANLGLGRRGAVLALYGLGILGGGTALVLTRFDRTEQLAFGALAALTCVVVIALLERAPFERQRVGKSVPQPQLETV